MPTRSQWESGPVFGSGPLYLSPDWLVAAHAQLGSVYALARITGLPPRTIYRRLHKAACGRDGSPPVG